MSAEAKSLTRRPSIDLLAVLFRQIEQPAGVFPMKLFHQKPTTSKGALGSRKSRRSTDGVRHPTSGKRFLLGFEAYERLQEDQVTPGVFGTPAADTEHWYLVVTGKFGDCRRPTVAGRRFQAQDPVVRVSSAH